MKKKISLKKIIICGLAVLGILFIGCVIYIFYIIQNVDYKYTGEELFEEVNGHRASIGVEKLELDPVLCDNLVERYLDIKEPNNGHKGFEEWVVNEGLQDNPKYGTISEMYIKDVSTPSNAIAWWTGSPGHKNTLEMPTMKYGCAYANDGTGVVIMAENGPQ